jgi:tetratricopeptide (TPR) repeat protein
VLIAITAGAIILRQKHPYIVTGWFWYLGMLVPVIGIIQVGSQAHADRYTYLPQIGLYVALTWAVVDLAKAWRHRWILGGAATAVVVCLGWTASTQAAFWRDSESLWQHALAVAPDNEVAHNQLGNLSLERGLIDEAADDYQKAVTVWPNDPTFQANLGKALLRKGLADEAILHFQKAIEPSSGQSDTERAQTQSNIGNALLQKGLTDDAVAQFQAALNSGIEDIYTAHIHYNLGNALRRNNLVAEAVGHCREALKREPRMVAAQNQLAWTLATSSDASLRNGFESVELDRRANELSGERNPIFLHTLAAAYAETGQFTEAISIATRALELAATQGNRSGGRASERDRALPRGIAISRTLNRNDERLRLVRSLKRFRDLELFAILRRVPSLIRGFYRKSFHFASSLLIKQA